MSNKSAVLCGYGRNSVATLTEFLEAMGFEVVSGERLDLLSSQKASVVFCSISDDISENRFSALVDKIQIIRISRENLPVYCTSDGNNLERIVRAFRAGATDFEKWGLESNSAPERLLNQAEKLPKEDTNPSRRDGSAGFHGILGQSIEIKEVFNMIAKVGRTSSTVLIMGESGTGKELVCKAIHKMSDRHKKPIIPVNCGAIPEELLESELFGHEKGAFTGATTAREGRFQMADGGTIFLDEVSEMSPKLQVKFLRVLQESKFERVGGGKTIHVDIRVIAATNRDLEQSVVEKKFREDLYYRLNVIPLHVPPLRERSGDISILVQSFMNKYQEKKITSIKSVAPDAMDAIQNYHWPGNVRELENLVERMAILVEDSTLKMSDLPERFLSGKKFEPSTEPLSLLNIPDEGINLREVVEDIEHRLIKKALEMSGGVKNRAAQLLGLNRTTLVEKLRKKNLEGAKAG